MTPRRGTFIGDGLRVTYALITYYFVTHWRVVYDPANSQVYAAAVLLWLALTLWGLGRIAFVLLRPALQAPNSGHRRPSPDERFTAFYEDHHDDHSDSDDQDRSHDSAR
jgi:hypothetical protein